MKLPATYVEGYTNAVRLAEGSIRGTARRIVHNARNARVADQRIARAIADALLSEADGLGRVLLPPDADDRAYLAREAASQGAGA